MTIEKNIWADIQDGVTQGLAAAELVNDNKRAVNEVIDVVNGLGTASVMTNASGGDTLGTASTKNMATNAEALAGTAGVLPDAAGVHAAFKQFGFGTQGIQTDAYNGFPATTEESITRVWRSINADGIVPAFAANFHFAGGPQWGRLRVLASASAPIRAFIEGGQSAGADLGRKQAELHHSGNMQPDIAQGLNSPRLMRNVSGATVNSDATTAGSGLRFCNFSTTGALTASATAGTGTWKNISGTALAANEYGLFVRIA